MAGQAGDGERLSEVGGRPLAGFGHVFARGGGGVPGSVLGLAAGPVEGDDHAVGDGRGGFGAVVVAVHVQAQVDARGHSGAGEDAAFVDEQEVGGNADRREPAGKFVGPLPVRGRLEPVEQARAGEGECPDADRRDPGAATASLP
jgi:hypothetical protein